MFSRPQLLSTGLNTQIVKFHVKRPARRGSSSRAEECVLKFFRSAHRLEYQREIAAYEFLLNASAELDFLKPFGYAEWPITTYRRAIGRNIQTFLDPRDSTILVLMLEYIRDASPLSSMAAITPNIAALSLDSLMRLHDIGVGHGDISTSNILLIDKNDGQLAIWIDFAASTLENSAEHLELEYRNSVEYFARLAGVPREELAEMVSPLRAG